MSLKKNSNVEVNSMSKKSVLISACLLSLTVQGETLKVLWVGNSLTYFNKMPDMVTTAVHEASGVQLISTQSVAGGTDWSFHLGKSVDERYKNALSPTLPHLQSKGGFDWVVIQNHSMAATSEKYKFQEFGDELIEKIRATGAEPLIYCTMSRRAGEKAYAAGDREKIIAAYETLAKRQNAVIAPVGQAWKIAQEKRTDLDLFIKDGLHPNPVGGYLTACVFYSVFTGRSPVGIDLPLTYKFHPNTAGADGSTEVTLSDELADFLQQCAQQALDETKAKDLRVTIQ
jgi:hypothetical protein